MEEWKEIKGYEHLYLVSNFGRVYSFVSKIYLKSSRSFGYNKVSLFKYPSAKSYKVHQLVARAFLPMEQGKKYVNHINGIRHDNRVENLEWCSHQENMAHAFNVLNRKGSMQGRTGSNNPCSKKIAMIDKDTGFIIKTFHGLIECERQTGFKNQNISSVCRGIAKNAYGYSWKYI